MLLFGLRRRAPACLLHRDSLMEGTSGFCAQLKERTYIIHDILYICQKASLHVPQSVQAQECMINTLLLLFASSQATQMPYHIFLCYQMTIFSLNCLHKSNWKSGLFQMDAERKSGKSNDYCCNQHLSYFTRLN